VPTFDAELRDALALILKSDVPASEGNAMRFYRQWLAEQNLGLVAVSNPKAFEWAGHWIARVQAGDTDHAVVMFGVPSGPLHDPQQALAAGGSIEEGWVLARLDLQLPADHPYGDPRSAGAVAGILVAPAAEAAMVRVETARAVEGHGLEGDRYRDGRGTFSGPGRGYQLTLVEAEVLEDVGLPWEQARRNIVTRGVDLNALVGRRFTVGEVQCIGRRLAEPCSHLERLSGPGILRPLVHQGGLRADILSSGVVATGDRLVPEA
jgi:MOSC domain-containing protein YiiM